MKKFLLGLVLLVSCYCFVGHASIGVYTYLPGTVATYETLNTAMVKINMDGITKEAMIVVPYMKNDTPSIEIVTMTTSTLEYSYVVPAGTSRFQFQARTGKNIFYSYASGGVLANNYFTLKADKAYWQNDLFFRDLTVYFKNTTDETTVIEFETWR